MDLQLQQQTAVIIGGADGIGAAIAEQFAAEGCRVAVVDINPQVEKFAAKLDGAHQVQTLGLIADATNYAAMQHAARGVQERFGGCQHVVYAAGVGSGKFGFPFWNLEPEDWERVLRVNLIGAVNAAHAFVPALIENSEGSLLFISSVAGQIGSQTDPPYSAAKAGVINFAQCAAKDLASYGVRVNALCPGMIKSKLNRSVWQAWHDRASEEERIPYEQWAEAKIKQVVPLGRWQQPQDVADMAVFLASARGRNITGQTINVDGGFVMHW